MYIYNGSVKSEWKFTSPICTHFSRLFSWGIMGGLPPPLHFDNSTLNVRVIPCFPFPVVRSARGNVERATENRCYIFEKGYTTMLTNITITLKVASVSAYVVPKGTKKPVSDFFRFPVTFRDNRDYTGEEIEELVEKEASRRYARLAYVESYVHDTALYTMPVESFISHASVIVRASKADGGTGRTREPIISREIGSSTVTAYVVPKGTKKPVERLFTYGEIMTEDEAEKAVEKDGKRAGFRLAYVDNVTTDSKLYAMPLKAFITLATKTENR